MVDLVGNDHVMTSDQRRDRSEICAVPGGDSDRRFGFFEGSDLFFEFNVDPRGSCEETDAMGPRTELVDGLFSGSVDLGVSQEIKVRIGCELKHRTSVDCDVDSFDRVRGMHVRIEIMFLGFLDPLVQEFDSGQKGWFTGGSWFCHGLYSFSRKSWLL